MKEAKYKVGERVCFTRFDRCLVGKIIGMKRGMFSIKYVIKMPLEYVEIRQNQILCFAD